MSINSYIEYFINELHLSITLLMFFLLVAGVLFTVGIQLIGKFTKKENKELLTFVSLLYIISYISGCTSLLGYNLRESEKLYTTTFCDKLKDKIEYKNISCQITNNKTITNQNKADFNIFLKISLLESNPINDMYDLEKRKNSNIIKSKHYDFYITLKSYKDNEEYLNTVKEDLDDFFNNNIEKTAYFKLNKQIDQIAKDYNEYISTIVKKEEKYGK